MKRNDLLDNCLLENVVKIIEDFLYFENCYLHSEKLQCILNDIQCGNKENLFKNNIKKEKNQEEKKTNKIDEIKDSNINDIEKEEIEEEEKLTKQERLFLKTGQPLFLFYEKKSFELVKEGSYTYYLYPNEDKKEKWKKFIQIVKHADKVSDFGKLTTENLDILLVMSRAANFYHYDWKFETSTGKLFVTTRTEEWYFYPFAIEKEKSLWHKNRNFNSGYHFQRRDNCSAEENIRFFHFHECEKFRVKFLGDVAKEKSCKGEYKEYRPNSWKKRKGKYRARKIKI